MSFTLTSSGAAIIKAGANANSDIIISGAAMQKFSDQAEGRIAVRTRRDWVGSYSTLPDYVKEMLDDVASSSMAKAIINYDIASQGSTLLATTMLDVNDDIEGKGISSLKQFTIGDVKKP